MEKYRLSASSAQLKSKGYYKDFKPIEVTTLEQLGKLMTTHSLSSQLYGEKETSTNGGQMVKYRRAIDNIIGHGQVVFFDIDNTEKLFNDKGEVVGKQCVKNPVTLKLIIKTFKKLGWGCVITPSKSSTKEWEKFHIGTFTQEPVSSHVHFASQYLPLAEKLSVLNIDLALKSSVQNLSPCIDKKILAIVEGNDIPMHTMSPSGNVINGSKKQKLPYDKDRHNLHFENSLERLSLKEMIKEAQRAEGTTLRCGCHNSLSHGGNDSGAICQLNSDDTVHYYCAGCDETILLRDKTYGFKKVKNIKSLKSVKVTNINKQSSMEDRMKKLRLTGKKVKEIANIKMLYPYLIAHKHHAVIYGAAGSNKTSVIASLTMGISKEHNMKIHFWGFDASITHNVAIHKLSKERGLSEGMFNLITEYTIREFTQFYDETLNNNENMSDVVIVLDTLKFLTKNINDKNANKDAMHYIKRLQGLGATCITLSHSNKNGVQHSGTAEIEQDSDALFRITKMDEENGKVLTTIAKDGRVRYETQDLTFSMKPTQGENYLYTLMKTVKLEDEAVDIEAKLRQKDDMKADKYEVNLIKDELKLKKSTQTQIISKLKGLISRRQILKLLDKYENVYWFTPHQGKTLNNTKYYDLCLA